ncbi:MAG: hypothetical protein WCF33_24705 [Pseudonocardiaceae bacterium]
MPRPLPFGRGLGFSGNPPDPRTGMPSMRQESPMSGPAHWARSRLDYHTLPLLPGLTCERRHLNFLADSNTRGSPHPQDK